MRFRIQDRTQADPISLRKERMTLALLTPGANSAAETGSKASLSWASLLLPLVSTGLSLLCPVYRSVRLSFPWAENKAKLLSLPPTDSLRKLLHTGPLQSLLLGVSNLPLLIEPIHTFKRAGFRSKHNLVNSAALSRSRKMRSWSYDNLSRIDWFSFYPSFFVLTCLPTKSESQEYKTSIKLHKERKTLILGKASYLT